MASDRSCLRVAPGLRMTTEVNNHFHLRFCTTKLLFFVLQHNFVITMDNAPVGVKMEAEQLHAKPCIKLEANELEDGEISQSSLRSMVAYSSSPEAVPVPVPVPVPMPDKPAIQSHELVSAPVADNKAGIASLQSKCLFPHETPTTNAPRRAAACFP
jgi:hypothetical protein